MVKGACLLLLLSWVPLAAQNGSEQPLTITITALAPSVKAGSDVWVVVKIANHSTERLDETESISGMTSLDPNLVFDVRDRSGNLIAKKVYEHTERTTQHNLNRCIESGATLTQQQNISRFYDVTQPGSDEPDPIRCCQRRKLRRAGIPIVVPGVNEWSCQIE